MCGRFYVDDDTAKEIQKLVRKIDEQLRKTASVGDIHPTERAAAIAAGKRELEADIYRWGFPGFGNQKVLINARAETVLEKRMFRDSVWRRRIAIPAAGFYEWNRNREKVMFTSGSGTDTENEGKGTSALYLAGFYHVFEGEKRFIILTTAANESMRDVHDRMPLTLRREELDAWLRDDSQLEYFLTRTPGPLKKKMEYEQQTLTFL